MAISGGTGSVVTNVIAPLESVRFQWVSPLDGRATFRAGGNAGTAEVAAFADPDGNVLIDQATGQLSLDVAKNSVYYLSISNVQSGAVTLSWTSGSKTAGHFRFTTSEYRVSEGDSNGPKDPETALTTVPQARITVTRDGGSSGAVDVTVSYESYIVTNTYSTNQIAGTNFVANIFDSVDLQTSTFDAQGLPNWRAVDFRVPYITNIYPPSVGGLGKFVYVTIAPDYTNVVITNIVRTPQFTLDTTVITTNHLGRLLSVSTVTNDVLASATLNTNFLGGVRWSNSLTLGEITNYAPVDLNPSGLNFNITVTTNSTNVVATEFIEPLTPDSFVLHFDDFEMSKSRAIDISVANNATYNIDRQVPLTIEDAELDPFEDPNIQSPTFDGGTSSVLKILDDDRVFSDANGPAPTFYFEKKYFGADETAGFARLYVQRRGPLGATADIDFEVGPNPPGHSFPFPGDLSAGSDYATLDVDFQTFTGTLHWGATDNLPKAITIPLFNSNFPEFNEDFLVRLVGTASGFINPGNRDAIVTIYSGNQPAGAADRSYDSFSPEVPLPGANQAVFAVALQPPGNGRAFIGGDFSSVNTQPIVRVARLNSNGQLDTSFDPAGGPDGFVACLVPNADGSVFIGGDFKSVNGLGRYGIAKLDSTGAVDESFNPGAGCDGTVWAMAIQPDGKILIGGDFTHVAGNFLKHVARLNPDGSVDLTFNTSDGPNDSVLAVAYSAGQVVIGGQFDTIGNAVRNSIARLNSDGSLDLTFDPGDGADGVIHAVAVESDGKVLIGGAFDSYDFRVRHGIAQINTDGSLDTTYDPGTGFDDTVYSLAWQTNGTVVVGGKFTTYNGTRRIGVARLLPSAYLDTTFMDTAYNHYAGIHTPSSSSSQNFVFATAVQTSGSVLIAGDFDSVGGGSGAVREGAQPRQNFCRLVGGSTPGPGNIQLKFDNYTADENNLQMAVGLERVNGNLGTAQVTFGTNAPGQGPGIADSNDFTFDGPSILSWLSQYPTTWMVSDGSSGTRYTYNTPSSDNLIEGNETSEFLLSDLTDANFSLGGEHIALGLAYGRQHATFTIVDATKKLGTLAFETPNFSVNEADGFALITVIRTNGNFGAASVQYATSVGTATSDDYFETNGILDFAAGSTSATFKVFIKDDSIIESNKTVNIILFNPTPLGVTLATNGNSAVLSIVDNDLLAGRLGFSATDYPVGENAGFATVTVDRTGSSKGLLSVQYATSDGTAIEGTDYQRVTNTLVWNDGDSSSKSFVVPIINNTNVDGVRTVNLSLFNPSVSGVLDLGPTNATITILNDDAFGTFSFSSPNYRINERNNRATLVVVRNGGTNGSVSVDYVAEASTNISGNITANSLPQSGTLIFAPGQLAATLNINISAPPTTTVEDTYIFVKLTNSSPVGAGISQWSNAIVTISDPELRNEPAGSVDPTFNFSLGANDNVYTTSLQPDNKLIIGGEFTRINGLTRNRVGRVDPDGTLDKTFLAAIPGVNGTVRSVACQTLDPDSLGRILVGGSFGKVNGVNRSNIARLNLDGSIDATFNPGSGANGAVYAVAETLVGDTVKVLIAGAFTSFNGQPRFGLARLNSDGTLDSPFNNGVGVNGTVYAMALQPDGKIVIGGDFTMVNSVAHFRVARLNADGTLDSTFDAGAGPNNTVRSIAVHYGGGILIGGQFTFVAGNPCNYMARLSPAGAFDPAFTPNPNGAVYAIAVQVDGKIDLGGDFTRVNNVTRSRFTRLNSDGGVDPTINIGLGANGTVSSIALQPDGNIILAGSFTQFDGITRPHVVRIFGGEMSGSGTLEFTSASYGVLETATNALVTIRRRGGTDEQGVPVTVQFDTSNLTGTNGIDYTSVNTVIPFSKGETFATVSIPVLHNFARLTDATVQLALSNTDGDATITNQPTAVLTITNTDTVISFSIANYNVNENDLNGLATAYLVRSGYLKGVVSVDCATIGGSAIPGVRYIFTNQTVVFADGEVSKPFPVRIINNNLVDGDQTIGLNLSNFQGALAGSVNAATITIVDDDFGPGYFVFATNNFEAVESSGIGTVTVVRTNGHTGAASVTVSTADGFAIAGTDYLSTTQQLLFVDGQISNTFNVQILDDSAIESDETIKLTLSAATNASLGVLTNATLTILDDDYLTNNIQFSVNNFVANEGDGFATITVIRTNGRRGTVTVDFATSNGSATNGVDYLGTNGVLTFLAGESVKTFAIPLLDNAAVQAPRTVNLTLSNPNPSSNTFITLPTAVLTIADDDLPAGNSDPRFNANFGANKPVKAVAFTPENDVYVGGDFTYLHGLAINRIARMKTNGTVDITFNPGAGTDGSVNAIVVTTNTFLATNVVYIGGSFSNFNGLSSRGIARLLPNGTVDTNFNVGPGVNGQVNAMAVQLFDEFLVIGGDFATAQGLPYNGVARLSTNGLVDQTFVTGAGADGSVAAVAVQLDGRILVGGDFAKFNNADSARIVRLNADGSVDTSFTVSIGADATVRCIAIQSDGKIVVGGDFVTIGGVPRNHIARLNTNGVVDLTFDPGEGANGTVSSVAVANDGKIILGGTFTSINGNAFTRIARLNSNGSVDTNFSSNEGADGPVNSINLLSVSRVLDLDRTASGAEQEDRFTVDTGGNSGTIHITYDFYSVPDEMRIYYHSNLIYNTGYTNNEVGLVTNYFFFPGFGLIPFVFFADEARSFTVPYGPGPYTDITIVMNEGGNTNGAGTVWDYSATVVTAAKIDNEIAVGGNFTSLNGIPAGSVAVLTGSGSFKTKFDARAVPNRSINTIGLYTNSPQPGLNGKVLVGGDFTSLVGVDGINRIGRLNSDGTIDRTFTQGVGADQPVRTLAIQSDDKVIIGGLFTNYNGSPRAFLARLNSNGNLDTGFNTGVGLNNAVYSLAQQPNGQIIIGGAFTLVYGAPRNSIARIPANGTGVDVNFNPGAGANGPVKSVALQADGKVLIGGDFTVFDGTNRASIARLNSNGKLDLGFDPGYGANGSANVVVALANGQVLVGGVFTQMNSNNANNIARLNSDGSFDSTFQSGLGANDYVSAIVVQPDGKLLVEGAFTDFDGQIRNRVVRLNSDGSLDPTIDFGTGANDFVNAAVVQDTDAKMIFAGGFTAFNDQVRLGLARVYGGGNSGAGLFQFSASTYKVDENKSAVITVVRKGGATGPATVVFSTSNGTAIDGTDFAGTNVVLNFANAENVKTVTLPIVDNNVTNANKSFNVSLSNPTGGAGLGNIASAVVTIKDNDCVFSFSAPTYSINEDGVSARITILRTGGSSQAASVKVLSVGGTATPDVDYVAVNANVVFNAGVNVQTMEIPIIDDDLIEGNETVVLTLANQTGPAALGQKDAVLTIVENDLAPGVIGFAADSFRVDENAGTITMTVLRTNGYTGSVSANFVTGGGTATPGSDYFTTNGVVSFGDGQTSNTVTIRLIDDLVIDGNKTFLVQLQNPSGGATLGQAVTTVTIVDDESAGTFEFAAPVFTANETGGLVSITIVRKGGKTGSADISYQTVDNGSPAFGVATAGLDYVSTQGTMTFVDGETNKTFSIQILDDSLAEGTETVALSLFNPSNGATVGAQSTAALRILDDETSFSFSATSYTATEDGVTAVIGVDRIGGTNGTVSVNFATTDGGATAGQDYVSTNGVLTFLPGETNKTFTVKILEDNISESTESVNLTLSNPSIGIVGPNITVPLLILDNDPVFNYSGATYSVTESSTNVIITVVRTGGTNVSASVNAVISDGTATRSVDYSGIPLYVLSTNSLTNIFATNVFTTNFLVSTNLSFAAGQLTNSFLVTIIDDSIIEGNETVNLSLVSPTNAVLGNQPTAVLTIVDNDMSVGFASTNFIANEKGTNAVVTLVRHGLSTGAVSVNLTTDNGTATGGVDYQVVNTTVTWANNDIAPKTVLIPVVDDGIPEGSETILLSLSNVGLTGNPTGFAFIETPSAVLSVVDNAGTIAFAASSYSVNETNGFATIQVVRTGGSNGVVTAQYTASGGTATAGIDYTNATGTIAFGHGETVKNISLPILNDSLQEGPETVNLTLSNPGGGALLSTPLNAVLTITDDDVGNLIAAGYALTLESIAPANNSIDPGETVTMQLALRNVGVISATNVSATLQSGNGVQPITTTANYGTVLAGGNSVSRSFQFKATGTNGSLMIVTLQLSANGVPNLGKVTYSFIIGTNTTTYANTTAITVNDNALASPYPTAINVSGVPGPIAKVTATLNNVTHPFLHDVQALLVGPSGQSCVLIANCGQGANNVTLTFDDAASISVPTNQTVNSGTYLPTRNGFVTFPTNNTPVGPYGSMLSVFNGTSANGTWLLYVYDGSAVYGGVISGGWNLSITASNILTPSADVNVSMSGPSAVIVGKPFVYTIAVTNSGPGTANNVSITNTLPAGVTYVGASRAVTYAAGKVICNFGTISNGANATLIVTNTAPLIAGNITNLVVVGTSVDDVNLGNNLSKTISSVIPVVVANSSPTVTNSNFQFTFYGQAGYTYVVDGSTNLVNWTPVWTNVVSSSGNIQFIDPNTSTNVNQFYRLRVP